MTEKLGEQSREMYTSQWAWHMLDALQKRIDQKEENTSWVEKYINTINEAILSAKQKIDSWYIQNLTDKKIADISNPWIAWGKFWIFSWDENKKKRVWLQEILNSNSVENDKIKRFVRQIWRTEISNYLIEKLEKDDHKNKGWVVEQILASQEVSISKRSPDKALNSAKNIDDNLKTKEARTELAKKMDWSKLEWTLDTLRWFFPKDFKMIKIIIWWHFVDIKQAMWDKLEFTKVHYDEKTKKIYAIMKNWCKWNLVEIELAEDKQPEKEVNTIKKTIDILNGLQNNFEIKESAIMSLPWFFRDKEMKKETVTQDIKWKPVTYEKYYLCTKWTNINPDFYLLINTDNPDEIWIWKIRYSNYWIYCKSKDLPIDKTFVVDKNNTENVKKYLESL